MEKRALRFLILIGLFRAALCNMLGNHYYVTKKLTWLEARDYCREYFTDLSSIHTEQEDELFLQVESRLLLYAWIGLYKDDNKTWTWSGGKSASFFIWSEDHIETENARCVLQTRSGWLSTTCEELVYSFFCFASRIILVKEKKPWEQALEHCRNLNRDLMSVSSEAAQVKALQTSRTAETGLVWTGLRYLGDSWQWVDGTDVDDQTWSQEAMPQCPVWGHHCGALSLEGKRVVSWDCADTLNFICL